MKHEPSHLLSISETNVNLYLSLGLSKYNQAVYDKLMNLFDMLPIAAVIDKKYFAVHGGISPHCKTIS